MSGNLHLLLIQATPYLGCDYLNTVIRQGVVDGPPSAAQGKIAFTGFTLDKTLYIVKSLYIKTGLTGAT